MPTIVVNGTPFETALDAGGNAVAGQVAYVLQNGAAVPNGPGAPLTVSLPAIPLAPNAATDASLATLLAAVNALIAQSKPIQGVTAMVVGTALAAGRGIRINASVTGDVVVTYTDGSTDTVTVPVGLTFISGAITKINSSAATATFALLK